MPQASDYTGTAFTPGQTVLYSFNLSAIDLWFVGGFSAFRMTDTTYQAKVANAFAQWSAVANVSFQYTASVDQADIALYWHNLDGNGGTLGYASSLDYDGDGVIDHGTDVVYVGMDPYDTEYFDLVILHEAGHAIGLDHISHTGSVMAPYVEEMSTTITSYDIAVAQSIYGAPASAAVSTGSTFSGTTGEDLLQGTGYADVFYGGSGADTIVGGDGDDLIYGNREIDQISAGNGADTLYGGQNDGPADSGGVQREGIETVYGGAGDDLLYGNMGADLLWGEDGSDVLYGGQDDDTLQGGGGDDLLFGNLGDDAFQYNVTGAGDEGHDTIRGWTDGDRIELYGTSVASTTATADGTQVTLATGTVIDIIGVSTGDLTFVSFI